MKMMLTTAVFIFLYLSSSMNQVNGFQWNEEERELAIALRSYKENRTCEIPDYFHGEWYSLERGQSITTSVNSHNWTRQPSERPPSERLRCVQAHVHEGPQQQGKNWTFLMIDESGSISCYYCLDVLWRTRAILQFRLGNCLQRNAAEIDIHQDCQSLDSGYGLPYPDQVSTMFNYYPAAQDCRTTFEGTYQFSYEVSYGGGGICNNPNNILYACPDWYNRIRMTYSKCPDVSTSKTEQIRYNCLGSWQAMNHGIFYSYAAVMDTVEDDPREKFKCLMYRQSDKNDVSDLQFRMVMSRFSDCSQLNSIYSGPTRLLLTQIPNPSPLTNSSCSLPGSIIGNWVSQDDQSNSTIRINTTHVMESKVTTKPERQDTLYLCQYADGNKYMMLRHDIGKCEDLLVCLEAMPNQDAVVSYRVGIEDDIDVDITDGSVPPERISKYLSKKFEELCTRNNEWKTIVLNDLGSVDNGQNTVL